LLSSVAERFVEASGGDPAAVLSGVVASVARSSGLTVQFSVDGAVVIPDPAVAEIDVPAEVGADGWMLPGMVRETLLSSARRHTRGVHHTPFDVAVAIVTEAWGPGPHPAGVVADPCVGGGVFLVAAVSAMGGPRGDAVGRVVGCDIDPLAVATTVAALALWSGGVAPPPDAITVGDFLDPDPFHGATPNLVVGNPPFLSQLRGDTVRTKESRSRTRRRWAEVGGFVDESMLFLMAAIEAVAPGGRVALVQPTSVLAARDSRTVREMVGALAPVVRFWAPGTQVFGAAVDICAVVCERDATTRVVERSAGLPPVAITSCPAPSAHSWAPLLAGADGTPRITLTGDPVSSTAVTTAGFRDQYYGLRDAVVDDPDGRYRLVTSGLIDPLTAGWGLRPCRYDRRAWNSPAVLMDRLAPPVVSWFRERLRPKILVATQTKVIELIVDPDGSMIPCTPVVVVEPRDPAMIWHLAAALTAPCTSATLCSSAAGSGLSADAIRVSASMLSDSVLPGHGPAWDRAAGAVEALHHDPYRSRTALVEVGELCDAAYGVERPEIVQWWAGRLPARMFTGVDPGKDSP